MDGGNSPAGAIAFAPLTEIARVAGIPAAGGADTDDDGDMPQLLPAAPGEMPVPAEVDEADAPDPEPDDADEADVPAPDPFGPISDADRARAAAVPAGSGAGAGGDDDTLELRPCREQSPPLHRFRHAKLGEPSRVWVYRDAAGAPQCVAARYDVTTADGSPDKQVLPWSYGRRVWTDRKDRRRDSTGWHCKAPPEPRPLYGLDRLAERPDAPVLICEGEKSTDAAGVIFPDSICITSQGGSKAPRKSDWSLLCGRHVTIWPDHDEAGAAYAVQVAELVTRAGAASVRTVELPIDWPAKWDLADKLPDDVTDARLREMLADAPEGVAPEFPQNFYMATNGLFYQPPTPEPTRKNPTPKPPPPIWVAAPFRVIGETRSDVGEDWGLLWRWRDRDGRPHEWSIPRQLIHRPGNEIAQELEHAGLSCGSDPRAHELLKRFVGGVKIGRRLRCVNRTGWHQADAGPVFVLPGGETFGRGSANVILQTDDARRNDSYAACGNLADWKSRVAALAVGNDRVVLFMAAGFAGPLLDVLGEPSGGIHLVGDSRTGKSTVAALVASVWGRPEADAQMRQWRGTANGLEAAAAETSDTLLILDEMGQADATEVADVIYMLANNSGKQRASRTGSARRRQCWRTLFLSTGELSLAQKIGEAGKRAMAGLDVRLVSLPADAGANMGVFQTLHGRSNAAVLAEELKDAARKHHGRAARAFLARLAQDRSERADELRATLGEMRETFLARHVPAEASAQVRSVAARFALIGAAGELAADYGVLPWPRGEALRASGACFAAYLGERGSTGSGEDAAALSQVRAFLEAHGESRFTLLTPEAAGSEPAQHDGLRTINRAGFRRRESGIWEYLVLSEAWKAEVCRGLNPKKTADLLAAKGWLVGGTERHPAAPVRIPGQGRMRLYRISGAILGDDGGGDVAG